MRIPHRAAECLCEEVRCREKAGAEFRPLGEVPERTEGDCRREERGPRGHGLAGSRGGGFGGGSGGHGGGRGGERQKLLLGVEVVEVVRVIATGVLGEKIRSVLTMGVLAVGRVGGVVTLPVAGGEKTRSGGLKLGRFELRRVALFRLQ